MERIVSLETEPVPRQKESVGSADALVNCRHQISPRLGTNLPVSSDLPPRSRDFGEIVQLGSVLWIISEGC